MGRDDPSLRGADADLLSVKDIEDKLLEGGVEALSKVDVLYLITSIKLYHSDEDRRAVIRVFGEDWDKKLVRSR